MRDLTGQVLTTGALLAMLVFSPLSFLGFLFAFYASANRQACICLGSFLVEEALKTEAGGHNANTRNTYDVVPK